MLRSSKPGSKEITIQEWSSGVLECWKKLVSHVFSTTPLLQYSIPLIGASGRTRTDDYEFTKLVLWLLRHRGKMASTAGIAPATSTFARWRSDLTELRGQLALGHLASVAGLAPALKEMQKAE